MPGKTNENQVYRWETGRHRISDDALEALAKVLEVAGGLYFLAPAATETETPNPFAASDPTQLDRIEREVARLHVRLDALTPLLPGIAELLGPRPNR